MSDSSRLPSLRSGLRLYLLVLIVSAALIVGLQGNIDIAFLRLIASLFVFGLFTLGALLISDVRLNAIMGRRPPLLTLPIGFAAGVLVWIPATWLLFVTAQLLGGIFGNLPQLVTSSASFTQQAISFGIIFPLCQGFLMFGYILSSAQGIGRWRGILLTTLLFGIFGQFTTNFGLGAIPGYLLVGWVGSVLVVRSGSAWPGILVLSGFALAEPIIRDLLVRIVLNGQIQDLFSFGWLAALLLSLLLIFALAQITFVLQPPADRITAVKPTPPGRLWWLPLIVVFALFAVIGYGEIAVRTQNGLPPTPRPNTGVTIPPVSAATPTRSATTKPAN